MLLISLIITGLLYIGIGLFVYQPWWLDFTSKRYYCSECHHQITISERFRIDYLSHEDRNAREV